MVARCSTAVAAIFALAAAAGCTNVGYYAQSIAGQLDILAKSEPIETLLEQPGTSDALRDKLELALQMREFATAELGLPHNESYTYYADVGRRFVLWNVFATPPLSLQPLEWCFPVAGCVAYRGYFARDDADAFAAGLRADGNDVFVAGIRAYSTLGWFRDPVLNTLINTSEEQLAGFVFHELSHQLLYVKGDTTFNESFATAVEQEGVRRWLERRNAPERVRAYTASLEREERVVELLLDFKRRLGRVYAAQDDDARKLAEKARLFAALKQSYADMSRDWPADAGYGAWFRQPLNNAHLVSVGTYHEFVPAFKALLAARDGDLEAFYAEAARIAGLDRQARRRELAALRQFGPVNDAAVAPPARSRAERSAAGASAQLVQACAPRAQVAWHDGLHALRAEGEYLGKRALADAVDGHRVEVVQRERLARHVLHRRRLPAG